MRHPFSRLYTEGLARLAGTEGLRYSRSGSCDTNIGMGRVIFSE